MQGHDQSCAYSASRQKARRSANKFNRGSPPGSCVIQACLILQSSLMRGGYPAGCSKISKCKSKIIDLHFVIWYNFITLSQQSVEPPPSGQRMKEPGGIYYEHSK